MLGFFDGFGFGGFDGTDEGVFVFVFQIGVGKGRGAKRMDFAEPFAEKLVAQHGIELEPVVDIERAFTPLFDACTFAFETKMFELGFHFLRCDLFGANFDEGVVQRMCFVGRDIHRFENGGDFVAAFAGGLLGLRRGVDFSFGRKKGDDLPSDFRVGIAPEPAQYPQQCGAVPVVGYDAQRLNEFAQGLGFDALDAFVESVAVEESAYGGIEAGEFLFLFCHGRIVANFAF